jgi:glutamyl-tRNA reductase
MLVVLLLASNAFAQSTDDIEVVKGIVQAERKMVVAKNMNLIEAESEAFWAVYNDYQNDLRKVREQRTKALQELAEHFEHLSDEKAQELLRQFLDFQEQRVKMRKSYLKKFGKVLPPKKVVRYYQIENKIDTIIDYGLSRGVPLVR